MNPGLKTVSTSICFQFLFWAAFIYGICNIPWLSASAIWIIAFGFIIFYGGYFYFIQSVLKNTNKIKPIVFSGLFYIVVVLAWQLLQPATGILEKAVLLGVVFAFSVFFSVYAPLKNYSKGLSETEKNSFELNMLKSQFNPHFLFNTLNIIYSKCHADSPEAAEMIQNLSAFMRYLINDCSKGKVLLQKEITMIHDYINLYKLNYNVNLNITFRHKLYDQGQKIAPMLLLNFVENAFKHSHIAVKKDAFVVIELATDQNYLHFKVINNKAAVINRLEKGIGNNLTLKQLELTYPDRHEYKVTEKENEYEVFLKIKL